MFKKIILGVVGLFAVVLIIGVTSGGKNSGQTNTSGSQVGSQPTTTSSNNEAKPALKPIILSGSGTQATNKFKLNYSLYKVTSDNPYVLADLLDSEGSNYMWEHLFGKKGFWYIPSYPADYVINVHNVDASLISSWKIRLEPIKVGDNPEARQFTGTGSKTTDLFNEKEGLKIIKATHSGKGTFTVILYDDSAVTYESLGLFGKVTGQFEGSKGIQFRKDGRYFFDVEADGDWSIDILPSEER